MIVTTYKTGICRDRPHRSGFSLIELMVAVAIVGILAAIAYPSYTRYVTQGKRSAAQSFLYAVANKQEQYLLDNRAYTSTLANLTTTPADVSGNYTVAITVGTAPPSYTITATATGAHATADAGCTPLTLTQDGTKSPAACW